jgi:hypothetical protein
MRTDAASLLARLGRTDFRYREFSDAFADMELWPVFEAILTDENVVGKPLSGLAEKAAEGSASKLRSPSNLAPDVLPPAPPESPSIFQFYGTDPNTVFAPPPGDLRGFLSRLAGRNTENGG